MQTKDWLILLIPIICNGFLIYFFQTLVSHKVKKNDTRKDFILDIVEKLSVLVCEEYENISAFMHEYSKLILSPDMKPAPFMDLWNPITEKAIQIFDFVQLHSEVLQQQGIQIGELESTYDQLVSTFVKYYGIILSDTDRQIIFQCTENFRKSVTSLNSKLEKIFLAG